MGTSVGTNLTPTEITILRELAIGHQYEEISRILRKTLYSIHVHAQHIRQKTGIRHTKGVFCQGACAAWLDEHPEVKQRAKLATVPTPRQFEIMVKFAAGKDFDQIAREMGISKATATNQMAAARARAGIYSKNQYADRRKQIQDYLERHEAPAPVTMADPMCQ
jgi:DNA-binding CsgD family transcriptional regulator